MNDIVTLALPFFALIFFGFGAGKLLGLRDEGLLGINLFVLYFALPALFFKLISETPIEQFGNWRFIFVASGTTMMVFAIGFILGRFLFRGTIAEATLQALAASYGNIGYMAPGLTLAAFGAAAVVPTALIFSVDNALFFILAPLGVSLGSSSRGSLASLIPLILKRIFTHPFIIATILGLLAAATGIRPPEAGLFDRILTSLSNAAAPCALFAMGVAIAARPVNRFPVELPVLIGVKLILHPVLVYVMLSLAGSFDPIWVFTAVIISSLPCATNVFVLANQYGVWVNRASSAVVISTIAAVGTVTGLLYLIGAGILPADLFP